jgi:hypothetical protein
VGKPSGIAQNFSGIIRITNNKSSEPRIIHYSLLIIH